MEKADIKSCVQVFVVTFVATAMLAVFASNMEAATV